MPPDGEDDSVPSPVLVFASALHGFAIAIVGRRSHIKPQQISLDSNKTVLDGAFTLGEQGAQR